MVFIYTSQYSGEPSLIIRAPISSVQLYRIIGHSLPAEALQELLNPGHGGPGCQQSRTY